MVLDRNTSPYYDDFDENGKYVQILYRPGVAVQSRELTQMQSIIQNQIDRFGMHIFKEGSMVIPGEVGIDLETPYVKLEDQFNAADISVSNFANKKIIGTTSGTVATVIDTAVKGVNDPNTLFVKYETGKSTLPFTGSISSGSSTVSSVSVDATDKLVVGALVTGAGIPANTYIDSITNQNEIVLSNSATTTNASVSLTQTTADSFEPGEDIITEDGSYNATVTNDSNGNVGFASRVQVKRGVYYALGYFLLVDNQSIILEKYSGSPSYKVGLDIVDSFVTSSDDNSLFDPAAGSPNFNAPGAHRYKVDLQLAKYDIDAELPKSFIELVRVKNGVVQKKVTRPDYSELEKTLARRTFDESGDYVVKNFPIQVKEHLDTGSNYGVYSSSNGGDESKLVYALEPGKAYVKGFEIETSATKLLYADKPRSTERRNNVIVPFSLGNYIEVDNLEGTLDISNYESVNLEDVTKTNYPAATIGTADVRGMEFVSGTPGTSGAKYRIYLFNIEMTGSNNFSDVRSITTSSGNTSADTVLDSNNNTVLKNTQSNYAIFSFPNKVIKTLKDESSNIDTSFTVKRYYSGIMSGNTLTFTGNSNEIFNSYSATNYHVSIVSASTAATNNGYSDGEVIDLSAPGNSVSLGGTPTGRQVTITIPDIADSQIEVIATLTKSTVQEKSKTLSTNSETVSFANSIQLSKADIFKITSITDDTTSADITDRFTLDNGQRDNFYDLGNIHFKTQYPAPTGNVTINYEYFQHGSGDYFSVDTYDGVIDYDEIQTFISPSTGKAFDLKDSIDFRPRRNDADTGFSVVSEIVASGENFSTDYDYYLPRIDKLILDSKGKFSVVNGIPEKDPLPPNTPNDVVVLYEITMQAYVFDTKNIGIKKIDNKRYTMRDIGGLEKRIESIEYYSALNLLEKETSDLFIDDGTGGNRFKSGFLVDNFTSHLVGNVELPEYTCSIDKENNILRAPFVSNSIPVSLSSGNSSNYQQTGDLITLPYTTDVLISQPFASTTENINPYDVFNWVGTIQLNPESDEWYDTEQAPDRVITNNDGLADSLAALNGQTLWNDWQTNWVGTPIGTTTIDRERTGIERARAGWPIRNVFEETQMVTARQGQTRSGIRLNVQETTTTQSLGDRVINTEVIPFIREKEVEFECNSLKPNTQVYPFFDDVDVSANVKPTGGSYGDDLISNVNGTVTGTFSIPNNDSVRFRTGERVFRLVDNVNNDSNFTTTSANAVYTARGILETEQETILSTRSARVVTTQVTDSRTTIGTDIQTTTTRGGWFDPLAQTFLIDQDGGAFLNKIDIYFAEKDSVGVPVTLQIRNVVNGYPGSHILPFAEVTLNPDQVNTSTDAQTATSFTFDSPVYLQDGQEYCFVLLANSIEYTIWTSDIGEFDVNSGERISEQPYAGVMFKSQNASTWTADQEKDIKFDIHRCVFDTSVTGNVQFRNETIPARRLPLDPFTTTNSSTTVNVNFPNHGLQNGETTTISGVSGTQNNIPDTELNASHTITYVDFDNFEIAVSTNADTTGATGGSGITATGNIRTDVINPVFETVNLPGTSMGWGVKVRDTSNNLHTNYLSIETKSNLEFPDERIIYNSDNESSSKSVHLQTQFTSSNDAVSPVIDLERASVIAVSNRVNNDSTNETNAESGDALARYITKKVSLATPATTARVYFGALRPPKATIKVYIKYLKDDESDSVFDDLDYTELTQVEYPDGSEIEYKDYVFEIDSLEAFSLYSIKIVLLSSETSDVPRIIDFRTIALGT